MISKNPEQICFFNLNMAEKELLWDGGRFLLNHFAIVVVPHQDDESIAMGGSIAKLIEFQFDIHIIYTTVEKLDRRLKTNPAKRKKEASEALEVLGVSRGNVHFLDFPDGNLRQTTLDFSKSAGKLRAVVQEIEDKANMPIKEGETLVLTTSRHDAHRDHEDTFNLIKNAFRKKIIMEFPTVNHICSEFQSNCIIDISAHTLTKKKALQVYKGEISKRRILWEEIDSLDREFGKCICVESAESCFISWYGQLHNF